MQIGALDRRVQILRPQKSQAFSGEGRESFVPLATVWAQRLDLAGKDFFAAQQANSEATAKFHIRYRSDVDQTCRLVCEGRTYRIPTPPMELGRREWLQIMASEIPERS